MNFSFVFKLYFSSTFNYVQLNYKFLLCILHSLPTSKLVVPCVSSRTHPKVVQGQWEKKACVILGGRAPKKVSFHWLRKKMEVESKKKNEKKWRSSTWNGKLVICVFAVGHNDVTHSQCAQLSKRHHTHNSVFFGLLYFRWSYYKKYFVRYLQIKSSLVLTTKYSII